ncbi:MAG: N-acetylmuramoyl-L-alanine amidase [Flavobacteriales bacterium]|nr:N-acetylmuramoyl-L-alanine amidase [Flavobacteriales bacterium]
MENRVKAMHLKGLRTSGNTKPKHIGVVKRLIPVFLVLLVLICAAFTNVPRTPAKTFTVVLDAGHGGTDPGNLGTGRYKEKEKDVSLAVTLKVGKYIKEAYPDVEVLYTRKDDSFPTLKERCDIANNNMADLFMSIHCNASDNKQAYGSETFVMGLHKTQESLKTAMKENASIFLEKNHKEDYKGFDPNDPDTYVIMSLRENVHLDQSINLAKNVQDQFRTRVGRKDRGVKQAGFQVISYTNMPSVLVELGFITNVEEEDYLMKDEGRTFMASAIFRAFKDYRAKASNKAEASTVSNEEKPKAPVQQVTVKPADSKSRLVSDEVQSGICFKVQFLSSAKPLDKSAADFKGLEKVDEYLSNGVYKYLAGCTANYEVAKKNQAVLREMGFKDAFVVAFEDQKRIELSAALAKTK